MAGVARVDKRQVFLADDGEVGQAARTVPEYVLWQQVNGYFLDVRVYFGTLDPSDDLTAEAQAELAELAVPLRE